MWHITYQVASRLLSSKIIEMTTQKQGLPSFATIISGLSIVLYCAGFLRLELQLSDQKKRINALEDVEEAKLPHDDPNRMKLIKDVPGNFYFSDSV